MCTVMGDSGVNVLNGSIKELTFVQVSTIDGRTLQNTEIGSMLNTAAPTPEPFGSMADDGNSESCSDQAQATRYQKLQWYKICTTCNP